MISPTWQSSRRCRLLRGNRSEVYDGGARVHLDIYLKFSSSAKGTLKKYKLLRRPNMCYILEKHGIQHTFEKWKNWRRPRQKSINHKDPEFSMSNCQNIASSYVSKVLKILQLLNNYPNFIHFPCSRPKTVCLLSLAFSLNQVMLVFRLNIFQHFSFLNIFLILNVSNVPSIPKNVPRRNFFSTFSLFSLAFSLDQVLLAFALNQVML